MLEEQIEEILKQDSFRVTTQQLVDQILALLPQGDEEGLLKSEERSEIIQRDCKLWCPTKGEFLDEVGEVIAKANNLMI